MTRRVMTILVDDEDGTFCITCPEFPEVVAEDDTLSTALVSFNSELIDYCINKAAEAVAKANAS